MTRSLTEANRRCQPRIFDTDWLLLRDLRRAIVRQAATAAQHGGTALDFGCGHQPYREIFETRGMTYLAADFGNGADIVISETGFVAADDASADLVLSFQVLEHVRDLDTYISEARRLLRPGGKLILSTHGTWLYHPHPEDHRRWTRVGLISELESRGWKVDACEAIVGPLAWTTIIRSTGYAFALRQIPVLGGIAAGCLAATMNARAVAEDAVTPQRIKEDNGCVYLVTACPGRGAD